MLRRCRQAVDFVRERLQQGESPRAVCAALCDHCLAPNTEGCGKGCGQCPQLPCINDAWAAAMQRICMRWKTDTACILPSRAFVPGPRVLTPGQNRRGSPTGCFVPALPSYDCMAAADNMSAMVVLLKAYAPGDMVASQRSSKGTAAGSSAAATVAAGPVVTPANAAHIGAATAAGTTGQEQQGATAGAKHHAHVCARHK